MDCKVNSQSFPHISPESDSDITGREGKTPGGKIMAALALNIRKEGRIATLTKAQKHHRCAVCQEFILPATHYYSVIVGGSGLGGIKSPSRVHPDCLDAYLEKVKRSREQ